MADHGFGVVQSLSHVQLFATPWTVDHQAPLSMGFFRQEYWSGVPFTSPRDLPGLNSFTSPALAGRSFTTESLGKEFLPTNTITKKCMRVNFSQKSLIFAMIFIIFVKIVKCAMSLFYWIFFIILFL